VSAVGFIFDGCKFSEPSLSSPVVVGSLDPDCDGKSHVLSGEPPLTDKHVLLQQREQRFHCSVIRTRTDPSRRAREPVVPGPFDEATAERLAQVRRLVSSNVDVGKTQVLGADQASILVMRRQ
jgi:hypothetical protein